jgi:hypothetical protein
MQRRSCVALAFGALLGSGCAKPPPAEAPTDSPSEPPTEASTPTPAAPAEPGPDQPAAALEATADDGLDADIAELSASTEAAGSEPRSSSSEVPSAREIVYRVTPQGLVIEIDGIHLRPEAKPFKDKSGAYGIELVVKAESFDGRRYWVNEPDEGPLSIAGKVESKGGKRERFADQRVERRSGSGDELVMEGAPRRFTQRWPGRGQPKLWSGQTVTLEVGLWGVRAESERERPVRRLFEVKMVAGNKSPAVISPPTLDWGS